MYLEGFDNINSWKKEVTKGNKRLKICVYQAENGFVVCKTVITEPEWVGDERVGDYSETSTLQISKTNPLEEKKSSVSDVLSYEKKA